MTRMWSTKAWNKVNGPQCRCVLCIEFNFEMLQAHNRFTHSSKSKPCVRNQTQNRWEARDGYNFCLGLARRIFVRHLASNGFQLPPSEYATLRASNRNGTTSLNCSENLRSMTPRSGTVMSEQPRNLKVHLAWLASTWHCLASLLRWACLAGVLASFASVLNLDLLRVCLFRLALPSVGELSVA